MRTGQSTVQWVTRIWSIARRQITAGMIVQRTVQHWCFAPLVRGRRGTRIVCSRLAFTTIVQIVVMYFTCLCQYQYVCLDCILSTWIASLFCGHRCTVCCWCCGGCRCVCIDFLTFTRCYQKCRRYITARQFPFGMLHIQMVEAAIGKRVQWFVAVVIAVVAWQIVYVVDVPI